MKRTVFTTIIVLVLTILCASCGFITEEPMILEESFVSENQKIFPVLYYEDNNISISDMLSKYGYVHTFRLENKTPVRLENHSRTWSRTYPVSALDKFGTDVRSEYGRLMKYYKTAEEEIFLFCKTVPENLTEEYRFIKNDVEAFLILEQGESFFDLLYFEGNFYFFTFNSDDSDIHVYKFSEDLEQKELFEIKYSGMELNGINIEYRSAAIAKNTFAVPMIKDYEPNLFFSDMESGETKIVPCEYWIMGIIANEDSFIVVGYGESGNIIFDTFSSDGEILRRTEKEHPSGIKLSGKTVGTTGIIYMYGSEIYMNFRTAGKCCIASYNVDSDEWTNSWEIEQSESLPGPQDVKYTVKSGEEYYDIFPNYANE